MVRGGGVRHSADTSTAANEKTSRFVNEMSSARDSLQDGLRCS